MTPTPILEKDSASPKTLGGIDSLPSLPEIKSEEIQAQVPQHGIKKINIRKNFKPKVGKINL